MWQICKNKPSAVLYREQRDALLEYGSAVETTGRLELERRETLAELSRAKRWRAKLACHGLGIDADRWCMRDEKPAQPAASESAKSDIVRGGED